VQRQTIERLQGYSKVKEERSKVREKELMKSGMKIEQPNRLMNDKLVFERLKRDFTDYLQKDFFSECWSSAFEETRFAQVNYEISSKGDAIRSEVVTSKEDYQWSSNWRKPLSKLGLSTETYRFLSSSNSNQPLIVSED